MYLRQQRYTRRPRDSSAGEQRGKITDMTSIHERPAKVAGRTVPGPWDGDLIMGVHNMSALGTLVQ